MTDAEPAISDGKVQLEPTFEALVNSRKAWIADVLKPWCLRASRAALRLAELEWNDIAGKVSPEKSLWAWAWGRFPDLVHPELNAMDESSEVTVTLKDGTSVVGYPDSRQSEQGQLVLVCRDPQTGKLNDAGPFTLEAIAHVVRVKPRVSFDA